eukprot:12881249-Prorocentrum_lima.AAC.1
MSGPWWVTVKPSRYVVRVVVGWWCCGCRTSVNVPSTYGAPWFHPRVSVEHWLYAVGVELMSALRPVVAEFRRHSLQADGAFVAVRGRVMSVFVLSCFA